VYDRLLWHAGSFTLGTVVLLFTFKTCRHADCQVLDTQLILLLKCLLAVDLCAQSYPAGWTMPARPEGEHEQFNNLIHIMEDTYRA